MYNSLKQYTIKQVLRVPLLLSNYILLIKMSSSSLRWTLKRYVEMNVIKYIYVYKIVSPVPLNSANRVSKYSKTVRKRLHHYIDRRN